MSGKYELSDMDRAAWMVARDWSDFPTNTGVSPHYRTSGASGPVPAQSWTGKNALIIKAFPMVNQGSLAHARTVLDHAFDEAEMVLLKYNFQW